MRRRAFGIVLCLLAVGSLSSRPEAHDMKSSSAAVDSTAVRELLEGNTGRRTAWASAPGLVIMKSVLDYASGDLSSGFAASSETLSVEELVNLTIDFSRAFEELTGGAYEEFSSVEFESADPGENVSVVRPGKILVGRFRGVQKKTGNLGYGGRAIRNGSIHAAAVLLDADFDRKSESRDLLRTHELGHALGYHHVLTQPSIMNPRVGSPITDFDRAAIRAGSLKAPVQF